MTSRSAAEGVALPRSIPHAGSGGRRVIVSAALGQFVEWYDFVVYAYSASIIARLFFPNSDPTAGLLAAFAVYGVGFLMRPLGGFVFGGLGDRFGRRRVLGLIILIMGGATLAIGLLPTYGQVGILAPVLLVICRLIQGLSAAGESIGSNAFVAEHAPSGRRGLHVGFTYSFAGLPPIVVALLLLFLTNAMTGEAYAAWGWRVPFLVGGPLALVGLYIRQRVDESPAFNATQAANRVARSPLRDAFRDHKQGLAFGFALAAFSGISFYTLTGYFVSYLITTVGLDSNASLISNSVALSVGFVSLILGGYLSDRFGRKPIILFGIGFTLVTCIPDYMLAAQGSLWTAVLGQSLLSFSSAFASGAIGITLLELFPTRIRYIAAAVSYNVSYTIFGGTAPFLATYLVLQTGSKIAPAAFLAAVSVVVFIATLWLPETSRKPLIHAEDVSPA